MRIALVTTFRRLIGGTEAYIEMLLAALRAAGHEIALWHEYDGDASRDPIAAPAGTPVWGMDVLGAAGAFAALRAWRPDVILSHGNSNPAVEASILGVAPTVMFIHAYNGACISGSKSRLSPTRAPCDRPLGWPCLLHYFPRRCGGLNPVTMARLYARETARRDLLPRYAGVLTASAHMRAEVLRYGVPEHRAHVVGLMISRQGGAAHVDELTSRVPGPDPSSSLATEWRLLFVARLTDLKGGSLLLRAMPYVRDGYDGRIVLTIAGDGPDRTRLEHLATRMERRVPNLRIDFAGWLNAERRMEELRRTHLLVVPSVWPEPFGLVGPEAGLHGVPAAAFAVGGIPEWLTDGISGHLAPGDRPTARGLAGAIVRSLRDPAHHTRLRRGARDFAETMSVERHLPLVLSVLARAAKSAPGARRDA